MKTSGETSRPVDSFEAFLKLVKSYVITVADGVSDHPLNKALKAAWEASRVNEPVVITGPPGADVESFAEAIHAASPRRRAAFVKFQCGLESDPKAEMYNLFGLSQSEAEKLGLEPRPSQFDLVHDGTLCLVDIHLLSKPAQQQLRSVFTNRTYPELPHLMPHHVHCRIIVTGPQDVLEAQNLVEGGLSFCLDSANGRDVRHLRLPSLAERKQDVLPLFVHYLSGAKIDTLDLQAFLALTQYNWPGNEREMQSLAEKLDAQKIGPLLTGSTLHERFGFQLPDLRDKTVKELFSESTNKSIEQCLVEPPHDNEAKMFMSEVKRVFTVSLEKVRLSYSLHITPRETPSTPKNCFRHSPDFTTLIFEGIKLHVSPKPARILSKMYEQLIDGEVDEVSYKWLSAQLGFENPYDNLRHADDIWCKIVGPGDSDGVVRFLIPPCEAQHLET